MGLHDTLGYTFPLVVHASLLITVTNALPLETRQTRVAQETSIVDQGENIWQEHSLEISIGVVAILAIAGWLYCRYRKRKEEEARLKAAKAASADRQPTEAEKKATAMEDARTGMMAWLFGFRSQLKA